MEVPLLVDQGDRSTIIQRSFNRRDQQVVVDEARWHCRSIIHAILADGEEKSEWSGDESNKSEPKSKPPSAQSDRK